MNEQPPEALGRNRRIAWLVAALLAVSARAEASHPAPNIPGLGPFATALVTTLAAVVLLGSVVVVVIVLTRDRSPR